MIEYNKNNFMFSYKPGAFIYTSSHDLANMMSTHLYFDEDVKKVLEAVIDNFDQNKLLELSKNSNTGVYVSWFLKTRFKDFDKVVRENIILNIASYQSYLIIGILDDNMPSFNEFFLGKVFQKLMGQAENAGIIFDILKSDNSKYFLELFMINLSNEDFISRLIIIIKDMKLDIPKTDLNEIILIALKVEKSYESLIHFIVNEFDLLTQKTIQSAFDLLNFESYPDSIQKISIFNISKLPEQFTERFFKILSSYSGDLTSLAYELITYKNFLELPKRFRENLVLILLKNASSYSIATNLVMTIQNNLSDSFRNEILTLLKEDDKSPFIKKNSELEVIKIILSTLEESSARNISKDNLELALRFIVEEYFNENKNEELLNRLIKHPIAIGLLAKAFRYECISNESHIDMNILEKMLLEREKQWDINDDFKLNIESFTTNSNLNIHQLFLIIITDNPYRYIIHKLEYEFDKIPQDLRDKTLISIYKSKNSSKYMSGDLPENNEYSILKILQNNIRDISIETLEYLVSDGLKNKRNWGQIIDILAQDFKYIDIELRDKIIESILLSKEPKDFYYYINDMSKILLDNFYDFTEISRNQIINKILESYESNKFLRKILDDYINLLPKNMVLNIIDHKLNNKRSCLLILYFVLRTDYFDINFKINLFTKLENQNLKNKFLPKFLLYNFKNMDKVISEKIIKELIYTNNKLSLFCVHKLINNNFFNISELDRNTFIDEINKSGHMSKSLIGLVYNFYYQIPRVTVNKLIVNLFHNDECKAGIINFIDKSLDDNINYKIIE